LRLRRPTGGGLRRRRRPKFGGGWLVGMRRVRVGQNDRDAFGRSGAWYAAGGRDRARRGTLGAQAGNLTWRVIAGDVVEGLAGGGCWKWSRLSPSRPLLHQRSADPRPPTAPALGEVEKAGSAKSYITAGRTAIAGARPRERSGAGLRAYERQATRRAEDQGSAILVMGGPAARRPPRPRQAQQAAPKAAHAEPQAFM